MVTHTKLQFEAVVAGLNQAFDGWMDFQLAGSLSQKPASSDDADIIVYPKLPSGVKGFLQGCKNAGIEIVALDDKSTTPFPGRPGGQDRIQVKLTSGYTVDLFFPKGYISGTSTH
ncbi:MAG: hypothetical protein WCC31_16180 [Terracidiphilus sp.]